MALRLETRHLRLVQVLSEEGTLTKAAQRLYLTQSALSKQLLELEARLGAPLFVRAGKRLIATQAGERLLDTARPVLLELARAEHDLLRIAKGSMGRVRLSTECYTCYHWLPCVLEDFHLKHPNVDIDIVTEATHRPVQALLDGDLDLAITSCDPEDARLVSYPLFADELLLVVHPSHGLAMREHVEAHDLADEHLITYALPREEITAFTHFLNPAGVVPRRVSTMELTEGIIALVRANVGVAMLAGWAVAPEVQAGAVRAIRATRTGMHRQWVAVTLRQEPVPAYITDFISLTSAGPALIPRARQTA